MSTVYSKRITWQKCLTFEQKFVTDPHAGSNCYQSNTLYVLLDTCVHTIQASSPNMHTNLFFFFSVAHQISTYRFKCRHIPKMRCVDNSESLCWVTKSIFFLHNISCVDLLQFKLLMSYEYCHIHHKSVCIWIYKEQHVDNGIISRAAQEIRTALVTSQVAWEAMLQNTFQRALLMK